MDITTEIALQPGHGVAGVSDSFLTLFGFHISPVEVHVAFQGEGAWPSLIGVHLAQGRCPFLPVVGDVPTPGHCTRKSVSIFILTPLY